MLQVESSLRREILCGGMRAGREIRMAPALAVVATTSTPVNFVTQFAVDPHFKMFKWNLEGQHLLHVILSKDNFKLL